ncbi:MAG TPA: PIN domain-containing protein [Chloroflexi bacterium]|nr:PIN domain-containing protein [Chloroflexota bacterium]
MSAYVTDTHALLWHLSGDPLLSAPAADIFCQTDAGLAEIVIPSIVLVEVVYLCERQRVPDDRIERILALPDQPGSRYRVAPLDEAVVRALRRIPRAHAPDMPDRIIGATALCLGLPLITRDSKLIGSQLLTCVW